MIRKTLLLLNKLFNRSPPKNTLIPLDTDLIKIIYWGKHFETGNALIDKQNEQLVNLVNLLANMFVNKSNDSLFVFRRIYECADIYFKAEEDIYASVNDRHKNEHAFFLLSINNIINEADITKDQLVFIIKWVVVHILDSDVSMGKLASQSGLSENHLIIGLAAMYETLFLRAIEFKNEINKRDIDEEKNKILLDRITITANQVPGLMFQFHIFEDGTFAIPYVSEEINSIYKFNLNDGNHDIYKMLTPVHPDDIHNFIQSGQISVANKTPWKHEYRLMFDDKIRWLKGSAIPDIQSDGSVMWHGFISDITKQKQTESDLRLAANTFELQDIIIITDEKGFITKVNKAFINVTGYTKREAIGKSYKILSSEHHTKHFYDEMWSDVNKHGVWKGEVWSLKKSGGISPDWLTITAIKSINKISHFIFVFSDLSLIKEAEEKIKRLAFYDPLTDLPNRRLLEERVKHRIEVEKREGKTIALLMLDLDRFKMVNDSYGHLAGDELLKQVGKRISDRLRSVDMVARLGGDEFVILLDCISHEEDAARVASEIIHTLSKPFRLSIGVDVQIGASIGISLFPEHGCNYELLMDRSDTALYKSKETGRGCYSYFSEDQTLAARERISLDIRLRKAVDNNEFCLFYQPKVDILSGEIIGAEALIRWIDPVEGLISPTLFIPIAEETGLILEIGEWVLHEACRQGRLWLNAGLPPLTIAVNVSPQQFQRCDIFYLVADILSETKFPSKYLEIEVTESGLMTNHVDAVRKLSSLQELGVHIAIDDFGTGYSSFSYLKNFPLDILKIDKSFVDDIPFNNGDMEIASSIIAMGHILGFKVLAEGVETPDQLEFLKEKGCDMYQGYIKSKPLPADEFVELLREQYRDTSRHWRI